MKKLRDSLPIRTGAWILFLAVVSGAVFFGFHCLRGGWCQGLDGARETGVFAQMVEEREQQVLELLSCQLQLKDDTLDYVDRQTCRERLAQLGEQLDSKQTSFRYQVLSSDGSQVLLGNLEGESGLEALVSQVFYRRLTASGVGQVVLESEMIPEFSMIEGDGALIYSIPATEAGEDSVVLRCGVLKPDRMEVQDEFSRLEQEFARCQMNFAFYLTLALSFAAVAAGLLVFLLWASGGRVDGEEVLAWPDRIFTEVWALLLVGGTALLLVLLTEFETDWIWAEYQMDSGRLDTLCALGTVAVTAWLMLTAAFLRTIIVRLKIRVLARTTLLCRLAHILWKRFTAFFHELPLTWKTLSCFFLYLATVFAVDHLWPFRYWYPLPGAAVNLVVLMGLCWWSAGFGRVRKGTEIIATGNLNHQIETAHLPADLRGHAEALNNISGGLTTAVNEQMKSERFKAELITNVSHDLKTPLTSIINYVNLLKTTDQTDPRAKTYIEVLDRKSQRLKKLTEDLVEASKASTGVLAVNREKIGMAQLLDQALGEYEEKLEEKQLTVVCTVPEGESYVYADGRHLWRVIDNLLSNCAKYALEGTRVYIELVRGKGSVSLSVKNISREALNIPPERLLERFVRGEESRSTEGSGLGLSIARSLTELQGGTFELAVDGDLFKAIVTLPQSS
ncbi:MAG: HAMP domain-containing histidine kinase [Oscillospiraceae bacterium]|nr:HAMP domain-containing histidine kinase [Oscillospiraceae bacterium]